MLLIKLLVNLFAAAIVIGSAYSLFYFRVVPRLIGHYRRFTKSRRKYDKEIRDIQKKGKR